MAGFVKPKDIKRTQDHQSAYRLNGALYIFTRADAGNLRGLYKKGTYAYKMPVSESIDIDTLDDFNLAELRMRSK
jgi:CMP-N,N'-diacetyllegionaminic acid synthase